MTRPGDPVPPAPRERPIVLKFGGAGLATGAGVERACARVAEADCARPVVVVSAIGEVTDLLEEAAREASSGRADTTPVRQRHKRLLVELGLEPGLLRRLSVELEALLAGLAARGACAAAERDHVLSFGERMSARVVAAALRARGLAAAPVDAWELGLVSDSNHGRARPLGATAATLGPALARLPGLPVVTGFIAADPGGRLTTLGRNGSDLTAALVGEAVGAREVQLWKCVPGVLSADPRLVPEARVLCELDYARAAVLAFHGAQVLHPDALGPLARGRVPARVAHLEHPGDPGTRIVAESAARGVLGLACRRGLARARLELDPLEERGRAAARVLAALASQAIEVVHLEATPGELEVVAPADAALEGLGARVETGLAALTVVAAAGADLRLSELERALVDARAAPASWRLDPARGTAAALVSEDRLEAAARALHARLLGSPRRAAAVDSVA